MSLARTALGDVEAPKLGVTNDHLAITGGLITV
jgi:hypothetical protein